MKITDFASDRPRYGALPLRALLLLAFALPTGCPAMGQSSAQAAGALPPRLAQSRRFLRERGIRSAARSTLQSKKLSTAAARVVAQAAAGTATWQPLGPTAVQTSGFGLISGRIAALAFDPSDATGNTVYAGTTGGGLWRSQNAAATAADVTFSSLTDSVGELIDGLQATSISIGAVSVQPGGTGVVLAGTGDVNDALDSYYGSGILYSTDSGTSWSLITGTSDGLYQFFGEGFAGFAWSTANSQLVVAAVAQAYNGVLDAAVMPGTSYQGLYYSTNAGASWSLATIQDVSGAKVQGSTAAFAYPDGNGVTSVVWNPKRQVFLAAVRYHGYYQSSDGITWTRLASQPGSGLTTAACPTNTGAIGSLSCPIYRGTLAVNPTTGDTFAWTVDVANQDQGIWQDVCSLTSGSCGNATISFGTQIATGSLETNVSGLGAATIANGDYNLALAAVPSSQDTLLLAGDNDLWKCSLAAGCVWRNTTNATTCRSAAVGEYQHALAWNASNSLQIAIGNDSGLWRSLDAIGETGSVCASTDASHFDNLNGGIGSLAETASLAAVVSSPYTLLAGLGVNGAAGVKSTTGTVPDWPQVLDGEGGPVAIDPTNASNWYVNNAAGVSIHLCAQTGNCTATDFGTTPVVTDADVSGDGYTMSAPAPFLVDPLDATNLLVGTCRVWRGPVDGSAWSSADAISGFLDGITNATYCDGNALIRSMDALALADGSEVIYVGMSGSQDGGATLAGHVFSATYTPGGGTPTWQDLALNPVSNDDQGFNPYQLDISSVYIDPHDTTGNTVYVTVQGVRSLARKVRTVYVTTDGGAHWNFASLGLPSTAANSIVVDPGSASTVYLATDVGVYATVQISTCLAANSNCWTAYGSGLPPAPVTVLRATPQTVSPSVLVAGTYGRGVWQIPLLSAGTQLTSATVDPTSLDFGTVAYGTPSAAQSVTVTNTGSVALAISSIAATGDFTETDDCQSAAIAAGSTCAIQVTFTPSRQGARTGLLTVDANVLGGALTVSLSGTGGAPGTVSLLPTSLTFPTTVLGATSAAQAITVTNTGSVALTNLALSVPTGFLIQSTTCTATLAVGANCTASIVFAPTSAGTQSGDFTVASNALAASAQATLTGSAFDFTVTAGSASQTVASGQTATYSLILTPLGGTSASFSYSCGTLPSYSTCSFNPSSLTVGANGSGTVLLSIATGVSTAAVQPPHLVRWQPPLVLCGLFLLPLACKRRLCLLFPFALSVALFALLSGGVTGCVASGTGSGGGGGGGGSGSGTTTPAGTYTIVITATASGVSHTRNLTLIVD